MKGSIGDTIYKQMYSESSIYTILIYSKLYGNFTIIDERMYGRVQNVATYNNYFKSFHSILYDALQTKVFMLYILVPIINAPQHTVKLVIGLLCVS